MAVTVMVTVVMVAMTVIVVTLPCMRSKKPLQQARSCQSTCMGTITDGHKTSAEDSTNTRPFSAIA